MLQQLKIQHDDREILLTVIRSSRKSIGLEVRSGKDVLVRIPNRLQDSEVEKFVEKHRKWILEKTELMQSRKNTCNSTGAVPAEKLPPEEIEKIKEKIGDRVKYYSQVMGCRTDFADIQNKKECGGNRQWQNHYLRNWAANTKGKGII